MSLLFQTFCACKADREEQNFNEYNNTLRADTEYIKLEIRTA
jgi:hypothetical protein